jgi:internalin A
MGAALFLRARGVRCTEGGARGGGQRRANEPFRKRRRGAEDIAPARDPEGRSQEKDPASCPKTGPVVFDNPATEAVVRRQLRKPAGPIARADLKRVKTLDLSQQTTDDELDPCLFPYLTGLKGLYLAPGEVDDLSLIKGATSLESLRVSATKVSDLAPLADLHKLDRLDVGRTPVRDLKPLAGLTSLTELQIDDTEVSDISPLASLANLEVLLLKRTRVSDISPLKGLRKLKHLYIEGSLVRDTSPLSGIAGLKIHEGA